MRKLFVAIPMLLIATTARGQEIDAGAAMASASAAVQPLCQVPANQRDAMAIAIAGRREIIAYEKAHGQATPDTLPLAGVKQAHLEIMADSFCGALKEQQETDEVVSRLHGMADQLQQYVVPTYDIETYCATVSQAVGGSYQIRNGCIDMERESLVNIRRVANTISQRIADYCDEVATVVGGSYQIYEGCVKQETAARDRF